MFPPMPLLSLAPVLEGCPVGEVWSDFDNGRYLLRGMAPVERLDWEYIYAPEKFQDMSGKPWAVFRKNCRKWPRKHPNWEYSYHLKSEQELSDLVLEWLMEKKDAVQDAEVLAAFTLSQLEGVSRKFLWDEEGIAAVNVWDENYKYRNFRFCICRSGEPFLGEFARLLFYRDAVGIGKWVNDGGTLDNPGLERFKDKMNPVRKREVFSWKKRA